MDNYSLLIQFLCYTERSKNKVIRIEIQDGEFKMATVTPVSIPPFRFQRSKKNDTP